MIFNRMLAGAFCVLASMRMADAGEIKILSPVALKPVLEMVSADFQRSTGHTLAIAWGESGSIKADVETDASFDIAILTPNFVDELVGKGKLDGSTRTPLARSG